MKILISILALLLSYNFVSACSCPSNANSKDDLIYYTKELKRATAVFQGKVISINPAKNESLDGEPYLDVEFLVLKSWKGIASNKIIIRTSPNISNNSCNFRYEIGRTTYVAAYKRKKLRDDYCASSFIDDGNLLKIFGKSKVFQQAQSTSNQIPEINETTEVFLSNLLKKVVSFFS